MSEAAPLPQQSFTVRVGLEHRGGAPTWVDFGDRLDLYRPRMSRQDARVELTTTVGAADLWLAVLLTMAAVAGQGYAVFSLAAELDQPGAD